MTSESFKRIAGDLQLIHRAKVRKIASDHTSGRHFYTSLDRSGTAKLISTVMNTGSNEGDLAQLYYSIRTLEALHGDCFDAVTDKALEAAREISVLPELNHSYPVRTLTFIRLMVETGLILPEEKTAT